MLMFENLVGVGMKHCKWYGDDDAATLMGEEDVPYTEKVGDRIGIGARSMESVDVPIWQRLRGFMYGWRFDLPRLPMEYEY